MALASPTREAREAAREYKIAWDDREDDPAYYSLPDRNRLLAWRYALAKGRPVIFGFRITGQFLALMPHVKIDDSGRHGDSVPVYTGGLHAAVVLAYDDSTKEVEIKTRRDRTLARRADGFCPIHSSNLP